MRNVILLIVDPQNDYCSPDGSVYIKGAEEDMRRLASFVNVYVNGIRDLVVTLDSHYSLHVTHALFWANKEGYHPKPYTEIGLKDLDTWQPIMGYEKFMEDYLTELETEGRYKLHIMPDHCVLGTPGHNIYPILHSAIDFWERNHKERALRFTRGQEIIDMGCSVIKSTLPGTEGLKHSVIGKLGYADELLIAGASLTHTLANSVLDLVRHAPSLAKKTVILTDATSPIPGCEDKAEEFFAAVQERGVKLSTTKEYKFV